MFGKIPKFVLPAIIANAKLIRNTKTTKDFDCKRCHITPNCSIEAVDAICRCRGIIVECAGSRSSGGRPGRRVFRHVRS